MRFRPVAAAAPLFLCVLATAPGEARAHGGKPAAYEFLTEPGNPAHQIIRSDLWGYFETRDGGATWRYVCAEVYGGYSLGAEHKSIVLLPGGRTLVANFFDPISVTDDGCTWGTLNVLPDKTISALALLPHDPTTVVAVASTNIPVNDLSSIVNELWRSSDGGSTWSSLGNPAPTNLILQSLAFSPSEPRAIWQGGAELEAGPKAVFSPDGGDTWTVSDIPSALRATTRIAGVHPTNPKIAFAWIDQMEIKNQNSPDEIWATNDAQTWRLVFASDGDLPGFAFSADGSTVYVSGTTVGAWSGATDDVLERGQEAFTVLREGSSYGLAMTEDGLLLGGNDYSGPQESQFFVGRSAPGADAFTSIMGVCDIAAPVCEPGTTAGRCQEIYQGTTESQGMFPEYIEPQCRPKVTPLDAGPGADAGGDPNPADGGGGGCGCSVPAPTEGGPAPWAVLAGLLAGLARRKRSARTRNG